MDTNQINEIKKLIEGENHKDIMKYVRSIVSDTAINKLNEAISCCDDCKLGCPTRTITFGNPRASVMIIADSIINEQISPSSSILRPFENTTEFATMTSVLQRFNVNPNELFWINAVNCKASSVVNNTTNYLTPTTAQINNCIAFVKYAVDIVHPSIILLVGNIALNIFKKSTIQKERGKWLNAFTIPAMPIYSPTHLKELRKAGIDETTRNIMVSDFVNDIKNTFIYLQREFPDNNVLIKPIAC